jgi:hypothetical protein
MNERFMCRSEKSRLMRIRKVLEGYCDAVTVLQANELFANAKRRKNPAQDVIGGDLAGDFTQRIERAAKMQRDDLRGACGFGDCVC